MITVLTSSTGVQLSTLANLKAMLSVTTTVNDDLMDLYLNRASEAVENYLGYPLFRQVYRETVAGYGTPELMVSRTPVVAVGSIYDDEDLIADTGYVIEEPGAGIIRRDEGFPWSAAMQREFEPRPVVGTEIKQYTVTYEAGYVYAGSTTTGDWLTVTTGRTLPYWAEQATLEAAKSWFKQRGSDGAVSSKRIGDLSITYGSAGKTASEMPDSAITLLRQHARSL